MVRPEAGLGKPANSTDIASPPEQRPTLSVPKIVSDAQIQTWRRAPGEPRPVAEIIRLSAGRHVTKVTIRDPYALGTRLSRQSQIDFLNDLKKAAGVLESIVIEYAPEADGDVDEMSCRREFNSGLISTFAGAPPKIALVRRSERSRDDDFHDRSVEIDVRQAGGAVRRHDLMIGRGLEALYNQRRQCTVTYVPPTLDLN